MVFLFQTAQKTSDYNNWFLGLGGKNIAGKTLAVPSDIDAARKNTVVSLAGLTSWNAGVLENIVKLGGKIEVKGQYGVSYTVKVEKDKKNLGAFNIELTTKGTGFKDEKHNIWANGVKGELFIDGKQMTTPGGATVLVSKENMQQMTALSQILLNTYVDMKKSAGQKTNAENVKIDAKWGKETLTSFMSVMAETTGKDYSKYLPALNQKNAWDVAGYYAKTMGKDNKYSQLYVDAVLQYYEQSSGDKSVPKTPEEFVQKFFAATAYLQAKEGLKSDGLFGEKTKAKIEELVKAGKISV